MYIIITGAIIAVLCLFSANNSGHISTGGYRFNVVGAYWTQMRARSY